MISRVHISVIILVTLNTYTGSAYRFYRSKCEAASAEKRGKTTERATKQRQYERKSRVCTT